MKILKIVIVILYFFQANAIANDNKEIELTKKYLSNFTTLQADFTQIFPGEPKISKGKIFISRPGKARWEYSKPDRILIITNNSRLSYYDYDLEQVSYENISDSAISLLLKKDLNFHRDIKVTEIDKDSNGYSITLTAKNKNQLKDLNSESLILSFTYNPLELNQIKRVNENGVLTTLYLLNSKIGEKLDDSLFIFKDPRIFKNKR